MTIEIRPIGENSYLHANVYSQKDDGTFEVRSVVKINSEEISNIKLCETDKI